MTEFRDGDLVKFKDPETLRTLPERGRWVTSQPFTLESINVGGRWGGEDADETWADGFCEYGSVDVWHPDEIELVMSAADAANRKPPTPEELLEHIGMVILGGWDYFEIDGTDNDGKNQLLVYGKTHEGLKFTFTLGISRAHESDF